MKQGMEHVSADVDEVQMFVIRNNDRIMINFNVNVKN